MRRYGEAAASGTQPHGQYGEQPASAVVPRGIRTEVSDNDRVGKVLQVTLSPLTLFAMRRLRAFWLGDTDLAPVSLFRVLYGVQLFNWVWQLYPNLSAFFTDEGILPRRDLLGTFADRF